MRRYYITDRRGCPDLLGCIAEAARSGVELIQIREKDLSARALVELTRAAVTAAGPWGTRLLVNGRMDVALAAGAHGVHLPSDGVAPEVWRRIAPAGFLIGVSCHTQEDLQRAQAADFVVFGPVFASPGKGRGVGLEALRAAVVASCAPVFALGGVDEGNAAECVAAGAAGVAAIRMFQRLSLRNIEY